MGSPVEARALGDIEAVLGGDLDEETACSHVDR
jgi:hypothetical protein